MNEADIGKDYPEYPAFKNVLLLNRPVF